jgi:hypothetical protein
MYGRRTSLKLECGGDCIGADNSRRKTKSHIGDALTPHILPLGASRRITDVLHSAQELLHA